MGPDDVPAGDAPAGDASVSENAPIAARRRSLLMWFGSFVIVGSFGIGCVLLIAQSVLHETNPYLSLATFTFPRPP